MKRFFAIIISISIIVISLLFFIRIGNVSVSGTDKLLGDDTVSRITGITEGARLYNALTPLAKLRLKKNAAVSDVSVSVRFDRSVDISVEYVKPIAAVYSNGNFLLVDNELNILGIGNNTKGIVGVYGFDVKSANVGEKIQCDDMYELVNSIELVLFLDISKFEYTPRISFEERGIRLYLQDFYYAEFGNGDNMEEKFNNFINIYYELAKKNVNKGIINISNDADPTYSPFIN